MQARTHDHTRVIIQGPRFSIQLFPVRFTIAVKTQVTLHRRLSVTLSIPVMCHKIESLRDSSRRRTRIEDWNHFYLRTPARIDRGGRNPRSRKEKAEEKPEATRSRAGELTSEERREGGGCSLNSENNRSLIAAAGSVARS